MGRKRNMSDIWLNAVAFTYIKGEQKTPLKAQTKENEAKMDKIETIIVCRELDESDIHLWI